MAKQQVVTAGPMAAASATSIRTASAGSAGVLVLDGTFVTNGVAILDSARRITITSTIDETANHFIIVGSGPGGVTTETITGANAGLATSVYFWNRIDSVTMEDTTAGNISIGTAAVGTSAWVQFDRYAPSGVAVQLTVTGTVNYTLQQTLDDPNRANLPQGASTITPYTVTWVSSADTNVVGATATMQTNYMFTPVWARILLNSGTGTVTGTFVQGG